MPIDRDLHHVSDADLVHHLNNAPDDLYVIWTGHHYNCLVGSARSRALATITEVGVPVSVRDVLSRAARIEGAKGILPSRVRSGILLHQGSKPAVYLLVKRQRDGDYVCIRDVKLAGKKITQLRRGAVALDRNGGLHCEVAERSPPGDDTNGMLH